MSTVFHRLHHRSTRLAELNHAGLQVAERALHKNILLLVMGQEVMPQGMLD
jgi:hypothetical protein